MNNAKTFKIEQLNFRIDCSDILPQFEIENDTSMLHIRPSIKEVEKLYDFIGSFLKKYNEKEKQREEGSVIILPYSGKKLKST